MQFSQATGCIQHQEDTGEEISTACSEASGSAASINNGNQSVTTGCLEPVLVFESNLYDHGDRDPVGDDEPPCQCMCQIIHQCAFVNTMISGNT